MALDVGKKYQQQHRHKRQWRKLLIVPIIVSLGALGFFMYDATVAHRAPEDTSSYTYTVDQGLVYDVSYLESNYFAETASRPAAYVRELTDVIAVDFSYLFKTEESAHLSYTYTATAHVIASHMPKGTSDPKTVWDASYPLMQATSGSGKRGVARASTTVEIPFRQYSQRVARINSGLALDLDAKAVVTFSVTVSGVVRGMLVNEHRTMKMTIPLGQSVYAITTDYDQRDSKVIIADDATGREWWRTNRTMLVVVVVGVLVGSVALLMQPWRRRSVERNPYRRELHRIYRYHDGLIIRTKKPLDLKGREGLSVASFDDLLTLSEELRTPIIASELSDEATRFVVLHEAMVYSFLLGREALTTPPVAGRARKPSSR